MTAKTVLVIGAGVQGSILAYRLRRAGHDVTLLARGRRAGDLQREGVVLEDASTGARVTATPTIAESIDRHDAFDVVLVVVGRHNVRSVLPSLAANVGTPNVVFVGNDLEGPAEMVDALGEDRTLLGFTMAGGVRDGHVVRHVAGHATGKLAMRLGEASGQATPRLAWIEELFRGAGFRVTSDGELQAWLKSHMAVLGVPMALAVNTMDALGASLV